MLMAVVSFGVDLTNFVMKSYLRNDLWCLLKRSSLVAICLAGVLRAADTDGDGLPDDVDPNPTVHNFLPAWQADATNPVGGSLYASYGFTPVTSSPVGSKVNDSGPSARHATARNSSKVATGVLTNNANGIATYGFDSAGSYHFSIDPKSPVLDYRSVESVNMWVYFPTGSLGSVQPIFSYVPALAQRGVYSVHLENTIRAMFQPLAGGNLEFVYRNWLAEASSVREKWTIDRTQAQLEGAWHNLTFVWQGGSGTGQGSYWAFYLDGRKQTRTQGAIRPFTYYSLAQDSFIFGAQAIAGLGNNPTIGTSATGNPPFTGKFDRVRLYTADLNATHIALIMNQDTDGDGASDIVERNISEHHAYTWTDPNSDEDGDGLTYQQELALGYDPLDFDMDGDLLPDGFEENAPCLDPLTPNSATADPDGDGLTNLQEYVNGTNPCVADTDGDTVDDDVEVGQGTDPNDNTDKPFDPTDHMGPAPTDPNMAPIGNLGVSFASDPAKYYVAGSFGDNSASFSERWQLNLGNKRLVNPQFGQVDNFTTKLNSKQVWEVMIQHVASNQSTPDFDYVLDITDHPGFILCDPDLLIGTYEMDSQAPLYWAEKTLYLIPTISQSYSESYAGGDAVGPRYRKVALNGRPIPDEKPEEEEETEVHAEQTYVDAYDLSLHHDTSFAHIPLAASDLILEANASSQEAIWSDRGGLRPEEGLTSPFGAGWSSNLCSYIEITQTLEQNPTDPISLNVVDEGGRGQRFATSNMVNFVPWPSSKVDKKTYLNELIREGTNLVLYKKYGNKLTYEPTTAWFMYSSDRLEAGDSVRKHVYYRLKEVEDRYGNKVAYDYGSTTLSLIPQQIYSVRNTDQRLLINRSTNGRRIDSITDARGNVVTFNYTARRIVTANPITAYTTLDSISYADGTSQSYTYETETEFETVSGKTTLHYHCNLKTVTDKRLNTHTFNYAMDTTKSTYSANSGNVDFAVDIEHLPGTVQADAQSQLDAMNEGDSDEINFRTQYGIPRVVTSVQLPGGIGSSTFARKAGSHTRYGPQFSAAAGTIVTDAAGGQTHYDFGGIHGEIVDVDMGGSGLSTSVSAEWMIYYTTMTVHHGAASGSAGHLGSESFEYDLESGLCLKKMTDFSGNVTTWTFGDALGGDQVVNLPSQPTFMTKWADPTGKVDALGRTESYSYGAHRVMTESVDVHNTTTTTAVDGMGRRTSMAVVDQAFVTLREETYTYSPTIPGFMTQKTEEGAGALGWDSDIVTQYVPDAYGRVWKEIVDPGGLALTSIHTYDVHNNRLTTTDPNGNVTTFHYDKLNRIYRTDLPATRTEAGSLTSSKYRYFDANGSKAAEIDENGNWTIIQRDALGRVVANIRDMDAAGRPSANAEHIISDTDLNDASVSGTDDLINRTTYNAVGYPIRKADARGLSVVTFVDALQRPLHQFTGIPSSISSLFHCQTLASTNDVTYTQFSYAQSVTIGGIAYATSPGASGFSAEGFKPTTVTKMGFVKETYGAVSPNLPTRAVYDSVYRPVVIGETYATGAERVTSHTYGAISSGKEALVSTVTDHLGQVTRTDTDGLGRPVMIQKAYGTALNGGTSISYSKTGLEATIVDELGRYTQKSYDRAGRLISLRQPDPLSGLPALGSPVTQTSYDANGNVIQVINPRGYATDTSYDGRNRPWKVEQPAVTNAGNPVWPVANVRPTTTTYYDLAGNVTTMIDPRGSTARNFFDRANRTIATRTNAVTGAPSATLSTPSVHDITSHQTLDKVGNVITAQDGNGNLTRNRYDAQSRLTYTMTDSGDGDPAPPGGSGFTPLDYWNTAATEILVMTEYDDMGNVTLVIDGTNVRTAFTYDGFGRKTRTIWDPGSAIQKTETSTYNALVQTGRIDGMGRETSYVYDARHRVTDVIHAPVSGASTHLDNTHTTYDLAGKILTVTYPNETRSLREVTYFYDKLDRLGSETSSNLTQEYRFYDKAGNRLQASYEGSGRHLTSTYDALNRLVTLVERDYEGAPTVRTTTYAYDLNGNVTRKTLPNGNKSDTTYDLLGRTLTITESSTAGVVSTTDYSVSVGSWPYSYDAVGNVLRIAETYTKAGMTNRVVANVYDHTYRLLSETSTPSGGSAVVTSYSYDDSNNRVGKIDASGTWVYTFGTGINGFNGNQLISYGLSGQPVTASFTYDGNGNRLTKVSGANTDTYTWDYDNRLTKLDSQTGASSANGIYRYKYDHRGRRVVREEPDGSARRKHMITFSGGQSISEYRLREISDMDQDPDGDGQSNFTEYGLGTDPLNASPSATYTPPYAVASFEEWAGAAILARSTWFEISSYRQSHGVFQDVEFVRGSDWGGGVGGVLYSIDGLGQFSYNAYNSRGDVVTITDGTGAATWQAAYEAFGTRTDEQGVNAARQRANTKDEDPTGLLNEGLRYRDLATGVFISRDPAGFVDGPNVYTYVRQNPWSHYDPVGLFIAAIAEKLGERFGSNPIVEAMAPHTEVVVNTTQNTLAVASMVPALGKVADGLSAGISAADGNYGEAVATAGGGSVGKLLAKLKKSSRLLGPGGELSRIIKEGGEQVQKNAEKVTKSARETAEQTAKQAEDLAPYSGGSHRDMSRPTGDGLDSHHMPDRGADPTVSVGDGPAIQMDPLDHRATSSHGGGRAAATYRAESAQMIRDGRYRDAMTREIRNVRNAAQRASGDLRKYTSAVRKMLDYARSSGQLPQKNNE